MQRSTHTVTPQEREIERLIKEIEKEFADQRRALKRWALGADCRHTSPRPLQPRSPEGTRPGVKPTGGEPEEAAPSSNLPRGRPLADDETRDRVPRPESAEGRPPKEVLSEKQEQYAINAAAIQLQASAGRPPSDLREMLRVEIAKQVNRGLSFTDALEEAKRILRRDIRQGLR